MEQKWDDEKEGMLVRVISDLLPSDVRMAIERTSHATNVRWSDVISIALASTDWRRIEAVMNASDAEDALAEAEDIISSDADPSASV